MKISEIKIGYTFNNKSKGQGVIIKKSKKTLTAEFEKVITEITYRYSDSDFLPSDFN